MNTIQRTAQYIKEKGPSFEETLKKLHRDKGEFGFLFPEDMHHEYYKKYLKTISTPISNETPISQVNNNTPTIQIDTQQPTINKDGPPRTKSTSRWSSAPQPQPR